jgi:MinD-like ATPase involved in chromosome partitioning or flagellar assembly
VTDAQPVVVVVDPDLVWQTELANALAPRDATSVPTLAGALELLPPEGPGGLFVGPNAAPEALARTAEIRQQRPGVLVVLVFDGVSVELLREAMQAGVYDVIDAKAERELLSRSLVEAVQELAGGTDQVARAAEAVRPAQLVVVTAAKDGEGATTFASNLAAVLADGATRSVALVDADHRFGDVALVMGLPAPAVGEGFDELGASRQSVLDAIVEHEATGVMVLVPPRSTAPAATVSEPRMVEVVSAVQAVAQIVVVDVPFAVAEAAQLWDYADRLILVSDLDAGSLKNSMIAARVMERSGAPVPIELVVNRVRDGDADDDEVRKIVGLPVAARLPAFDDADRNHEPGILPVMSDPEGEYSRAVRAVASPTTSA